MTTVNMSHTELEMVKHAIDHGITDPTHLANFMAQVAHESQGFTRLEESFRYTKSIDQIPVESAFRNGREVLEQARQEALRGNPEHLAEEMYGNRRDLGNVQAGDGYKYHGRGLIQLTGRANYAQAGSDLDLDLVDHPELASDPENAKKIAIWYWDDRVKGHHRGDVAATCKDINGGDNGLEDRRERFSEWQQKLSPELIRELAAMTPEQLASVETVNPPLKVGTRGIKVIALQEGLNRLGFTNNQGQALVADGDFGNSTKQAVQAFQRAQGLAADGIAGPATLAALRQALPAIEVEQIQPGDGKLHKAEQKEEKRVTPAENAAEKNGQKLASDTTSFNLLKLGQRGDEVLKLQETLIELGYRDAAGNRLMADGIFGERTKQAVEALQQAHGLGVDGIVGPQTRQGLAHSQQLRESLLDNAAPHTLRADLSSLGHPQHALYQQAYDALKKMDAGQLGFTSDQQYRNTAGTAAFEASVTGMQRIDHMAINRDGTGLMAVQGTLSDPSHQRVYMDKEQAVSQPLERSTVLMRDEMQNRQQTQQQQTQRNTMSI